MNKSDIKDTRDLVILGLFTALVTVATMAIQIPVPATEGYIHMGDSMIFVIGVLIGKRYGAISGGIGSSLADLLSGYSHWALPTLIIKGIMGYIVGSIADQNNKNIINFRNITALIVGTLWMVFGYLIGGTILKGSFLVALTSVPSNLIQGVIGSIIFFPLAIALKKTNIFKNGI